MLTTAKQACPAPAYREGDRIELLYQGIQGASLILAAHDDPGRKFLLNRQIAEILEWTNGGRGVVVRLLSDADSLEVAGGYRRQTAGPRPAAQRREKAAAVVPVTAPAEKSAGVFATWGEALRKCGLAVVPILRGEKEPIVTYGSWKRRPGSAIVAKWAARFPHADIALICDLSGLVVVDVDDVALIPDMLRRYGDTPLIVGTARGAHLYYRAVGGEACGSLRSSGLDVDIKAGRAIVVAPPSLASNGEPYRLIRGSWHRLRELPMFCDPEAEKPVAAPQRRRSKTTDNVVSSAPPKGRVVSPGIGGEKNGGEKIEAGGNSVQALRPNPVGTRNGSLFNHLSQRRWQTLEDVKAEALRYNHLLHIEPEEDRKALATASSVWRRQQQQPNRRPSAGVALDLAFIDRLMEVSGPKFPQDLALHVITQRNHGARSARGELFALSPDAMSRANTIPGHTNVKSLRASIQSLMQVGTLVRVREQQNIKGQWTPALYQLREYTVNEVEDAVIKLRNDIKNA
jgi:hypothetical protein